MRRQRSYRQPDAISIFTDGSALYDKNVKDWVEAGFGWAAIEGGDGPEQKGGKVIYEHCGPIKLGELGTKLLSNNVAEVHAFLHALRWARSPAVVQRPICLRHDSVYAALVSCGVYKARKNKALVLHAQEEWKLTMKAKTGKLWIRRSTTCDVACLPSSRDAALGRTRRRLRGMGSLSVFIASDPMSPS